MSEELSKKILLVDDEQVVLDTLGRILKESSYEVITTHEGEKAIELARQHHPDLIILDIIMPNLSGEDIAVILTEDISTASIPIIFLSGILTKEEGITIKQTGQYPILAKPVTANELLESIEKVLFRSSF